MWGNMNIILSHVVCLQRAKEKAEQLNEVIISYTLKNGLLYTIGKDKSGKVVYTNTMKKSDIAKGQTIETTQELAFANAMKSLGIRKKEWNLVNEFMTYIPVTLDVNLSAVITWHTLKNKITRYDIRYTKDTWSGYEYVYSYDDLIATLKKLAETEDTSEYETEFDSFLQFQ